MTNNGPLVQELTSRLEKYLGVENLLLVSNGTLALQVAYKVLGIKGEAITTPFSFVATTSSLVWEGINPIFADIDPETLCIDASKIEETFTSRTSAIVPVHVFGNTCEISRIEEIAQKHNIKTIYDAAHAFAIKYKGRSVLSYGDASILSFHATKLFHTIEGGAIVFKKKDDYEKARLMINFGIDGPDSIVELGINAKMNEFQAAMGLCVLDGIDSEISERQRLWKYYEKKLISNNCRLQKRNIHSNNNYMYFPLLLKNKEIMHKIKQRLNDKNINPRRYFYPSLDTLAFVENRNSCPISRDISSKILCLPIYSDLTFEDITQIVKIIQDF